MVEVIHILSTDVGDFPTPLHMIEAAKGVKWRKHDHSWPDMRTRKGREWVKLFRAFSAEKIKEYMAA